MSNQILPGKTIGIIGGGHVARMIALEAKKMGYLIGILDADPDCPAAQVADWHILKKYTDFDALTDFASKSDVLTFESEAVDTMTLNEIQHYIAIPQDPDTLAITQDRVIEKAFLESLNINITPYATITNIEDMEEAVKSIGFPCILKTIRVESAAPEQQLIYSEEEFGKAVLLLKKGTCILESWIPFERELAITVAQDTNNVFSAFPVTETLYRNNKLVNTITPARVGSNVQKEMEHIGKVLAHAMNLVGVLTIETFITSAGSIYVNRLVVRPHHSCNYSLDACNISQYEALVRCICGLPIPEIQLYGTSVTFNILQEKLDDALMLLLTKPDWHFHFYGKKDRRSKRKMGHVTLLGNDAHVLIQELANSGLLEAGK
ncbi:rudiment single hybrid motif [Trichococcus palustris]|jgi:5-(carboxyamino)imidazole ribonucleotide synthase|uniref:N5-carboxyaminoimidazole ribonucleotide synthase n=1 Tax=Trichococcus palustris TaxID=140314 RepID=A0A143YUU7_9LACT|nr:5-(carboxyamino)imidazole ribonucleotide synthase [Trichococcus palustris]CZQ99210.1 rudiment single hybrid motif [Trichococcus palustris]SFK88145.1 5-(carboxyamino)imidazole ribonucleotide synthase [Trichococcus palustris]